MSDVWEKGLACRPLPIVPPRDGLLYTKTMLEFKSYSRSGEPASASSVSSSGGATLSLAIILSMRLLSLMVLVRFISRSILAYDRLRWPGLGDPETDAIGVICLLPMSRLPDFLISLCFVALFDSIESARADESASMPDLYDYCLAIIRLRLLLLLSCVVALEGVPAPAASD